MSEDNEEKEESHHDNDVKSISKIQARAAALVCEFMKQEFYYVYIGIDPFVMRFQWAPRIHTETHHIIALKKRGSSTKTKSMTSTTTTTIAIYTMLALGKISNTVDYYNNAR